MSNLTILQDGQAVTTSRQVAENFGKEHKNILRDIDIIIGSSELSREMFLESTYENRGKQYPEYIMNRDGFTLLAMGFTGADAMQWKIKYIQAFNDMEKQLTTVKPLTQLEILAQSTQILIEQDKAIKELNAKQEEQGEAIRQLASQVKTSPNEYFTVAGYASLRGAKIDISKAGLMGRKASKLSHEYGVEIGKISDPRFGRVNTYHTDVLKEVFA